jgi:hypothetical protein
MIFWNKKPTEVIPGTLNFSTSLPTTEVVASANVTAVDADGVDVTNSLIDSITVDTPYVTFTMKALAVGIYTITVEATTDPGTFVIVEYIQLTVALVPPQAFSCDFDTTIGQVRFEIGDINPAKALLTDAEITYAYSKEGTVLKAAARLAESLAARFASEDNTRVVTTQWGHANISKRFMELAKRLRQRAVTVGQLICPSIDTEEKRANELDTTVVQPFFKRDIHKNPETDLDDTNSSF